MLTRTPVAWTDLDMAVKLTRSQWKGMFLEAQKRRLSPNAEAATRHGSGRLPSDPSATVLRPYGQRSPRLGRRRIWA